MSKAEAIKTSAQVEEEILSEGPKLRDCLRESNLVLTPSQVDEQFLEYADYYPDRTGTLWSTDTRDRKKISFRPKLLLLISGVAAGGKDELIKSLDRLLPDQMHKLVTATTRPPRVTPHKEIDGIDHYFYSLEKFQKSQENDEFIETMPEGDRWYGTPKQSINDAMKQSKPIIVSDVEIGSGWPNVEKYVASLPAALRPKIIKVFVLPTTSAQDYFDVWLPQHRPNDFDYRGKRAAWEIAHAPELADYIITNRLRDGLGVIGIQARVLTKNIQPYLSTRLRVRD